MARQERDSIRRFRGRAAAYAAWRPDYPEAAYDAALLDLDVAVAADVGAGTGIAARALAARGIRVLAVEPNDEMRAAANRMIVGNIEWIDAPAEATTIPAGACDLVLCAQSFHWFARDAALAEFRRILRPDGRLALLWNMRDRADPLMAEYGRVIELVPGSPVRAALTTIEDPLGRTPHFTPGRRLEFGHEQRFTWEGLLGRTMSVSYFPRSGPDHDRLVERLRALHERVQDHEGKITYRYRTVLWLTDRA